MILAESKRSPGDFYAVKCINKKSIKGKEETLENEIDVLRRLDERKKGLMNGWMNEGMKE